MARRPNYGYEKRQKEIKKQKKREAKLEKKRLKKEAAALAALGENPPEGDEFVEGAEELGSEAGLRAPLDADEELAAGD